MYAPGDIGILGGVFGGAATSTWAKEMRVGAFAGDARRS
jgi:hypothetical protein